MYFVLTGENMGFKLFQERMGEELYLKKLKEADEVCEMYISVRLLLLHAINILDRIGRLPRVIGRNLRGFLLKENSSLLLSRLYLKVLTKISF